MNHNIVFVGGGNMATSLISGLCRADCRGEQITAIEPDADKREALTRQYGIHAAAAANADIGNADVIVLAVKPQMLRDVAVSLAEVLGSARPLIISIAAGIPLDALRAWLGADLAYVRCMPNTPSLIGAGATGLYADPGVDTAQRATAESIMATAGMTAWVETEAQLDAVTATSGSGPAYFFAFMEALQSGAMELGLDRDTARQLVLHTALGAARMAVESDDDPATLREKVTSPGGATEQALNQLRNGDLQALVGRAMAAAAERAGTLAQELGGN